TNSSSIQVGRGSRRDQSSLITPSQTCLPNTPRCRRKETLIHLFAMSIVVVILARDADAQSPNPAPNCYTNFLELIWTNGAYGNPVHCSDPLDTGPFCPSSGSSGNGGPGMGSGPKTGHYIPREANGGIGSAEEEMAAAQAAGESLSGDGGCCG